METVTINGRWINGHREIGFPGYHCDAALPAGAQMCMRNFKDPTVGILFHSSPSSLPLGYVLFLHKALTGSGVWDCFTELNHLLLHESCNSQVGGSLLQRVVFHLCLCLISQRSNACLSSTCDHSAISNPPSLLLPCRSSSCLQKPCTHLIPASSKACPHLMPSCVSRGKLQHRVREQQWAFGLQPFPRTSATRAALRHQTRALGYNFLRSFKLNKVVLAQ